MPIEVKPQDAACGAVVSGVDLGGHLGCDEVAVLRSHWLRHLVLAFPDQALYASPGYTIGIDGMPGDEASAVLKELFTHQVKLEFVYRHRWAQGMLVMWDNRAVLHAATGGYEGQRRLLHRITVAERVAA